MDLKYTDVTDCTSDNALKPPNLGDLVSLARYAWAERPSL